AFARLKFAGGASIPLTENVFAVATPDGDSTPPPGPYDPILTCQATAVPPVVRTESQSDLIGDVVLVCLNSTPTPAAGGSGGGAPAPVASFTADVQIALNTNITNNIDFGAGA